MERDNRHIALDAANELLGIASAERKYRPPNTDTERIVNAIYDVGAGIIAAIILAEHWARQREQPDARQPWDRPFGKG